VTSLGAIFLPQWRPELLRDVASSADESGLDQLWLWEDCFLQSGLAAASAVLGWTNQLKVGIGLMPVPLRNVALTAMEIATMARLFPSRVLPGIGHGVRDWMAQVGAAVPSPMTLLEEYTDALQKLLRGERVDIAGRFVSLDGVQLEWPPTVPAPLYIGAVGPRTLQLSGRLADGTILTGGSTPDKVRAARAVIDEGRAATSRTAHHEVVVYLLAATGPTAADRMQRDVERWNLSADDDVSVIGDAATIAAAIGRWTAAGADTVVLQPTLDEPDPVAFVRFVGEEVRPLL
jgi:alkanesulfonate monooxygenase SsuD/methylene tetrahydromethanopterin reductase-like flavin-dependent oxidoreductase (luciferase family)